jgi:PhnB protein
MMGRTSPEEADMAVSPIPDGYHTVTPYLTVRGADTLLEFVKAAFDAEELSRQSREDGSIAHAEARIGDSVVMIGEANEQWPPMPSTVNLYVDDCDVTYRRALEAGATSLREPMDELFGDRMAGVRDPVGDNWWIATHVEDVSADEIARRADE